MDTFEQVPVTLPTTARPRKLLWFVVSLSLLLLFVVYFWRALPTAATTEWTWAYDDADRPVSVSTPGGRRTSVTYRGDDAGKSQVLEQRSDDGTSVSREVDEFGRVVRMLDASGSTRYSYDGFNRLVQVERSGLPPLTYRYDALGKLAGYSIGGAWTVSYVYDFLDRIATTVTPIGRVEYAYHAASRSRTRRLPNGMQTMWQSRPDGALDSITHTDASNRVLLKLTYRYRIDGRIDDIEQYSPQGIRRWRYEYDAESRLTSAASTSGDRFEYRYDTAGNLISTRAAGRDHVATYDWSGLLIMRDGAPVRADRFGNIAEYQREEQEVSLIFDAKNRLSAASAAGRQVNYIYDGDGLLVGRHVGQEQLAFLNDTLSSSTWTPLMSRDTAGHERFTLWEEGIPLAVVSDGAVDYMLTDHLGSVRLIADGQGSIRRTRDYRPFGASLEPSTGGGLSFGFAGLPFDDVVGLSLTKYRAYDPELGQFLQRDPLLRVPVSSSDFAMHAYTGSDPVNWVDRDGRERTVPSLAAQAAEAARSAVSHITMPFVPTPDLIQSYRTAGQYLFAPDSDFEKLASAARMQGDEATARGIDGFNALRYGIREHPFLPVVKDASTLLDPSASRMDRVGAVGGLAADVLAPGAGRVAKTFLPNLTKGLQRMYKTYRSVSPEAFPAAEAFKYANEAYGTRIRTARLIDRGADVIDHVDDGFEWVESAEAVADAMPERRRPEIRKTPSDSGHVESYAVDSGNNTWHGGGAAPPSGGGSLPLGISGGTRGPGPMDGSNVGGIDLRGAGDALARLGRLTGVAIDRATGRVTLISEAQTPVGLPPLRLDDIVTIFRSVYEHGEAPWVTIDPNPADPRGPTMIVRQGAATSASYVGWVLYESDRLMKTYSLSRNNVTNLPLTSLVPGFDDIVKKVFAPTRGAGDVWERFWIVPAEVVEKRAAEESLTVFDVPLKVNTQRMVMRNGKLVAAGKESTIGAKAFSTWFTEHYSEIAAESHSVAPKVAGIGAAVSALEELRRVALIAAIAEKLRKDGIELPHWMRSYRVAPVPFATTTPSITATGPDGRISIYGGVTLSPADNARRVVERSAEASQLKPLVAKALESSEASDAFHVVEHDRWRAVALPGADTKEVSGGFIEDTDLAVPTAGGELRLSRRFHSFFQPRGEFGTSWTLDLPELKTQRIAMSRTGDRTTYRSAYTLSSPLGTFTATFDTERKVPELNATLLVPRVEGETLGAGTTTAYRYGKAANVVYFRDGRRFYFDGDGHLVGWMKGTSAVLYRWSAGRLVALEAMLDGLSAGRIDLEFDGQGRVVRAQDSRGQHIDYAYDSAGHLLKAAVGTLNRQFRYIGDQITEIWQGGQRVRGFAYDTRGHVTRQDSGALRLDYRTARTPNGVEVQALAGGRLREVARFDAQQRLVHRTLADGSTIDWKWNAQGGVEARVAPAGQQPFTTQMSADRRVYEVRTPQGGRSITNLDDAGRLLAVRIGESLGVTAQWHSDGEIASAATPNSALTAHYDRSRRLNEILLHEASNSGQVRTWQRIALVNNRAVSIEDYSGLKTDISYDGTGEVASVATNDSEIRVIRSPDSETLQTSWGERRQLHFDPVSHQLARYEVSATSGQLTVEYQGGRPIVERSSLGGQIRYEYVTTGPAQGQLRAIVLPGGVSLQYAYDAKGRLTDVDCAQLYRLHYEYDERGRLVKLSQLRLAH